MKTYRRVATAFIATLLGAGCASGGGSGGGNSAPAPDPAYMPLRPGYEPSPCGTLYGYPVPCQSYLPRFPGDPAPTQPVAQPPLFTSWSDLRRDATTRAEGMRVGLQYFTAPDGRISSIAGPGMQSEPEFNLNVPWNALFRYDAQGRAGNFSLRGGGGDLSADTDQRTLLNLGAIGQPWMDVGYRRTFDAIPPTPFADLAARYLELVANPYVAGWNYQTFGVWNVTDPSWVSAGGTSFGSATPGPAVPTNGTATFNGKLGGLYISPAGQGSVATADVKLGADFSTRTLSFASSGTSLTRDLSTATLAPNLNLSGTLTYAPGSNAFSGTFTNAAGTMSGTSKGQFYGPAAQELGGVFAVKSPTTVETFVGAYGGKR
jgi:transferrin binding protein